MCAVPSGDIERETQWLRQVAAAYRQVARERVVRERLDRERTVSPAD
jgi:hypothetical protein